MAAPAVSAAYDLCFQISANELTSINMTFFAGIPFEKGKGWEVSFHPSIFDSPDTFRPQKVRENRNWEMTHLPEEGY